ncbi:stalk domain-containing protein [Fenollaria massiliensis]|uniref:Stalk domain-containing protein n=1 Tax=Fenollaria massiliensis TaxID=938288 RepID=A0A9E7IX55_9FIRM|nr:stalk domain-containing protein [Fenollaria massiliensis]UQK59036.1 stalk domain-containing protein [Fenollaria massiliensis]
MKKIRNILSLALVFIMLIGLMPMNVFAEPEVKPTPVVDETKTDEEKPADPKQPANPAPAVDPASNPTGDTAGTHTDPAGTNEELETAKRKAIAELDSLKNLSDTYKNKVAATIGTAGSADDVKKALDEAKALDKAKGALIAEVKDLKNLKDADKTKAINDIKEAEDLTAANNIAESAKTADKAAAEENKAAAEKKALEDAKKAAEEKIKSSNLSYDEKTAALAKIEAATTTAEVEKALNDAIPTKKPEDEKKPDTTGVYNVYKASTVHGSFTVSKSKANYLDTITVTATPNYGYAVKNVYYIDNNNIKHSIKNYAYNDYYYYGYNGRYYNDYNYYYSDYRNYYYNDYATYEDYLKDRHYSFWNNGYKYWDDYDYYKYGYKYGYKYYDRYYNDYYKYYDEYLDSSYRYSSYSNYLYNERYSHYKKYDGYYDYYDRYYYGDYYRYYGYTTSDTFTMPASNVTVYVEFTDWTYYGYYYDDYYYYRSRRDKEAEEAKAKKEAAKKEEEAKAKAEAEKLPQVYENKAVIAIGSNVLDKVSKNVHTVHQMDTPAYVKNGRVMLPLRYVAEALGLQVSWVPETKTVIIWDLTQRVEIPVKSNRIIVNGITYTSDVKPEIKSSRTMLPIANIARALGLIDGSDIIWDQYNKQVTLTRKVLSK